MATRYGGIVRNIDSGAREEAPLHFTNCLDQPIIVLANRAPIRRETNPDGTVETKRSASGLVTALEPLVVRYGGTWVAHGATDEQMDVCDPTDPAHPSGNPRYRIRYVGMPDREYRGYYDGFANEGLWPLCHWTHVRPVFRAADYEMYCAANRRFASAVCDLAGSDAEPIVLVQDYHFALAPQFLRSGMTACKIVAFWHIPWPDPAGFRTCPWGPYLLQGMLASDVVGFQTARDVLNFLEAVEPTLDARVNWHERTVTYRGRAIAMRVLPVGVEWDNNVLRALPAANECREQIRRELGVSDDRILGIGVDRLDYTKGIHDKFLAIEKLLDTRPEWRRRLVFVQVAEPSRQGLAAYRATRAELLETADRVNARFGDPDYRPIIVIEGHREPADVYKLYRAASFCYVGSLHDGMNLVAKEFVAARSDHQGVLVLSQFAGAANQLTDALLVNPYAADASADVLAQALHMSEIEQARRMNRMRALVARYDATWWAEQLLRTVAELPGTAETMPTRSSLVADDALSA